METILEQRRGAYTVRLLAHDQYNDYSLRYDYFVVVSHRSGAERRYEVGTDKAFAREVFNAAVTAIN